MTGYVITTRTWQRMLRFDEGRTLREDRRSRGWTQSDLAAKMKVHPNTVARMERGEIGISDLRRAQIATIFKRNKVKT